MLVHVDITFCGVYSFVCDDFGDDRSNYMGMRDSVSADDSL